MTPALAMLLLTSAMSSSMIKALPMRPPISSSTFLAIPPSTALGTSRSKHHDLDASAPSSSEHYPHSAAASNGGHSKPPPDSKKGKRFPVTQELVFDPKLNRLVGGVKAKTDASHSRLASSDDGTKAILTTTSPSWMHDFPGKIMTMSEVLARHMKIAPITANRRLRKYGTHEIARGLLSGNQMLEAEAVAKLPTFLPKKKPEETARSLLLGDQAEEITEKFRKLHNLKRKQATDKLALSLTPRIAALLKNPATFVEGARKLALRPYNRGHIRPEGSVKASKAKSAAAGKASTDAPSVDDVAHSSPLHQHPDSQASSPLQTYPALQEYHHGQERHRDQGCGQQPPPLHSGSHLQSAIEFAGPPVHAEDEDFIDFDAVMDWVNSNSSKGGYHGSER